MVINSELKAKLLKAGSEEEVKALLGDQAPEEEAVCIWKEIEAHRPADGLEVVDDDEMDAVSGGADRDWEKDGCAASVEYGSRCLTDDYCSWLEVTYDNHNPCPAGGKHDWTEDKSTPPWIVTYCRKCGFNPQGDLVKLIRN